MTDLPSPLSIDVVSDVMCPWCFIGKRHLDAALAGFDRPVAIRWRPFQLDEALPESGKDRRAYLHGKFGSAERTRELHARVEAAGAAADIPFAFDRIAVSPNTLDAHRVIRWAGEAGADAQERAVEALFRAYFIEGRNLADREALADIAGEAGMDCGTVARDLASGRDRAETAAEAGQWRRMGVTGVPTFIVGGRYAISGAQPANVLRTALDQIASGAVAG